MTNKHIDKVKGDRESEEDLPKFAEALGVKRQAASPQPQEATQPASGKLVGELEELRDQIALLDRRLLAMLENAPEVPERETRRRFDGPSARISVFQVVYGGPSFNVRRLQRCPARGGRIIDLAAIDQKTEHLATRLGVGKAFGVDVIEKARWGCCELKLYDRPLAWLRDPVDAVY